MCECLLEGPCETDLWTSSALSFYVKYTLKNTPESRDTDSAPGPSESEERI